MGSAKRLLFFINQDIVIQLKCVKESFLKRKYFDWISKSLHRFIFCSKFWSKSFIIARKSERIVSFGEGSFQLFLSSGCRSQYNSGFGGATQAPGGFGGNNFWTGAATGGLLGYMFGNRNSGVPTYRRGHSTWGGSGWGGSGWGGSSGMGRSSGWGGSSSSSGTRTASGKLSNIKEIVILWLSSEETALDFQKNLT